MFSNQLLDEMLDNGFPLATESNILKELIKPPNLFRSLTDTVTGKSTGYVSMFLYFFDNNIFLLFKMQNY